MNPPLPSLRASVERLHDLARGLDDDQLTEPSFCAQWTIADTLSHLGSGAVIMRRRLADGLAGRQTPDDFAPEVWDEWNAKSPRRQVDDALVEDEALLEALDAVSDADRARATFPMGPLSMGLDDLTAMRLNEHAFHTWDVEVALDQGATLPADAVAIVVDNLGLIARFTARPTGEQRVVRVRTTAPERIFTIDVSADAVSFDEQGAEAEGDARTDGSGGPDAPDLVMPAEAFARLVYGRLPPEPEVGVSGDTTALNLLRAVFPGP